MKLQKFTAAFLALLFLSFQSFAQINFQASKSATNAAAPQYQIFDIGVVQTGDSASQGFGVSTGGVAVGRSFRSGATQAFSWTQAGGIVGLPNLTARNFCVSNSANDSGAVVGTCATTAFGSGKLPTIWQNGAVSQLPLPTGQTLGDANDINASGVAVGSAGAGSSQRGAIYSNGTANVITQTTANGSFFQTAFRINNSGRVVGQGIDPNDAARNVGMVYDIGSSSAFEVGALPNANGAIAFAISNTGFVVGSSMQGQGSGRPFIWSQSGGIKEIPLPTGTSQGSARSVNSNGWAVGSGSSNFAIPFLYDGTSTYRLGDLIPANSGWDLLTNTSSAALGISDSGVIVGTGVLNGQTHAFAMIPQTNAPNKAAICDYDGDGKTDFALRRIVSGQIQWYVGLSGGGSPIYQQWGVSGDQVLCGDFDGDRKTDFTVWRATSANPVGYFYILESATNTFRFAQFGQNGDNPNVIGDYNGDGKTDLAVYRPGTAAGGQSFFYYANSLNNSSTNFTSIPWGINGDRPYVGDFDGDGKTDVAVQRVANSTGVNYVRQSSNNTARAFNFGNGASGDIIVPGDYNGDGKTDIALQRTEAGGRVWYVTTDFGAGYATIPFGSTSAQTAVGDYDGDGKSDIAVYQNDTNAGGFHFFVRQSSNGAVSAYRWGQNLDLPIVTYNQY